MDDNVFAEIDIEPAGRRSEAQPCSDIVVSAALPIAPRAPDPIREKFYEMRSLATKKPYPKNDSELFYRQARFMEDFTDTYDGDAKFNMYFPYYQRMGYDYLRTYFTWRTRVRSGDIRATSLSYIFLYIYELLSCIGVEGPADGLGALMKLWDAFSKDYTAIESYMPKWLKDYHVFYQLPHSFSEFVQEYDMHRHYSLTLLFDEQAEGRLGLWNNISGYDITKSRFYNGDNKELIDNCFDAVLDAIQGFCEKKDTRLEDMLVYSVSNRSPWQPFKNALFGSRMIQKDREVHISKYERYFCKNGQWTANLPVYYSSQKEFTGYIIKKTEACLRDAAGYKYKLVAEMRPGGKPFRELQRPAAKRAELDRVIEETVENFYRNRNRVVVEVDHQSLVRIREEALETQEQLIVEEDDTVGGGVLDAPLYQTSPIAPYPEELTLSFADGWKTLGKMLTNTERKALSLAMQGGGGIKGFAAEMNMMPEVLIDGINEKASDCIGDSILELASEESPAGGEVYVFEEYKENILQMVEE